MPNSPVLAKYDLGGATATIFRAGGLKLDGGAMFGIIPRPLWSRLTPPDDQHRIQLACNCILVEWPGSDRRVLIETGAGDKYEEKERRIYDIDLKNWIKPALLGAGVEPASITDVILSHLHFDHAGGLTERIDGGLLPTFPNARIHAQRREFDDARQNFGIMSMTYREENYTPIDDAGAWNLLDGECEIIAAPRPGLASIRCQMTPGHTRGHHSIVIAGADRTAVFIGDVMPTRHHLAPPYNMAYDLFPLDNRASKQNLLSQAAARNWLCVIDHDPEIPVVQTATEKQWFVTRPAGT